MKLNFSSTNNWSVTRQWMEAIEKKGDTLSAVYKHALVAAGSRLKQPDEGSDLDNDRANIESELDEQEDSEHEEHA